MNGIDKNGLPTLASVRCRDVRAEPWRFVRWAMGCVRGQMRLFDLLRSQLVDVNDGVGTPGMPACRNPFGDTINNGARRMVREGLPS